MGIKQEIESLRLHIEADRTTLESAISRQSKGPLAFMNRCPSIRFSSFLTGTVTYLFDRLVSGDSPEEIATRSSSLIKTFRKPI